MIKAIFFDIDGTLISFKTHQMPESTKQVLHSLKAKGIKLFIATGRAPLAIQAIKERLDFEFDGYITINGQYCFNDKELIYHQPIAPENFSRLLPYLEEQQIACGFVESDYLYHNITNAKVLELKNSLGDTAGALPLDNTNRIFTHDTYQLNAFIDENEEAEFLKYLPGCKSVRWNPIFADIIPADGGKPTGLKKVLDYYDLTAAESMAFGDGGNDIEMLSYAGIGVAMGNANDTVKKAADFVTKDIDQDGILYALKHFKIL